MKRKKILALMAVYSVLSIHGLTLNASSSSVDADKLLCGDLGDKEKELEAGVSRTIGYTIKEAKAKAEERKKKEEEKRKKKEQKRKKKEKERLAAEEAARKQQELETALLDFQDTLATRNETVIAITNEVGQMYGIKPTLLQAIVWYESTNNQYARNGGCYGYMQVSPRWHYDKMERHQVNDILDQYGNILIGTEVLAELLGKNDGNLPLSLMQYNGDSRAKYLNSIGDMSSYARKIINLDSRLTSLEELYVKYQ